MTTLTISPTYREAVKVAIALQVLTTLILISLLDGGTGAKAGPAAMAAFWMGAAVVILRRPTNPARLDLLYVRWGYLPMLVVAIVLTPLMGALR